jgi:mRNA interferase MazF
MDVGDILLIPFPFTDLSGIKTRPVLVLGKVKDDIIVAFISSIYFFN